MVINNDPCYAYLQESNAVTDQKLVMAHVYGHADFFKCNFVVRQDQPQNDGLEMANHATARAAGTSSVLGQAPVERFLDDVPLASST